MLQQYSSLGDWKGVHLKHTEDEEEPEDISKRT